MPDDIAAKIEEAAEGPQRVRTDAGEVQSHPLPDLIEADKYLASRDAGALSHAIDGAATQLDRTRDWLSSLEFDTSPSDIPEELAAAAPLKVGQ